MRRSCRAESSSKELSTGNELPARNKRRFGEFRNQKKWKRNSGRGQGQGWTVATWPGKRLNCRGVSSVVLGMKCVTASSVNWTLYARRHQRHRESVSFRFVCDSLERLRLHVRTTYCDLRRRAVIECIHFNDARSFTLAFTHALTQSHRRRNSHLDARRRSELIAVKCVNIHPSVRMKSRAKMDVEVGVTFWLSNWFTTELSCQC